MLDRSPGQRNFVVGHARDQQVLPHRETDIAVAEILRDLGKPAHLIAAELADRQRHAEPVQAGLLLRMDSDMGHPVERGTRRDRICRSADQFATKLVFDGEPEMAVALGGSHDNRRSPVAEGVRQEVRDDTLEDGAVDDGLEVVGNPDLDLGGAPVAGGGDELFDLGSDRKRDGVDRDPLRLEPGEVEKLIDEPTHTLGLRTERIVQFSAVVFREPVSEPVERADHAVDARDRRAELVRGEGDEVRLQLIRAFELEPLFALTDEEPRAVERQACEGAERLKELDLVASEEGRIRSGPDDEASARDLEPQEIGPLRGSWQV